MSRRDKESDTFYDLDYKAWREGRGELNRDRFDDALARGLYPDEITLDMVCPKRHREEEQEPEYEQEPEQDEGTEEGR